jgi:cyclopropane-fatty-acyl-phospholipid synthase
MTELSVSDVRYSPRLTLLKPQWARKLLFKVLTQLEVGQLTIRQGDNTFQFGACDRLRAEIEVHDDSVYRHVLAGGTLAAGESYMRGEWSSPELTAVTRVFSANLPTMERMQRRRNWVLRAALHAAHWLNRNTLSGSRRNIAAHYDLGNDFFGLFLDPTMMYSAALFRQRDDSLEVAAEEKLDEICRQLDLTPDCHVLEIGTGWGGMAIHAAKHYGCRVTTTTISREQYEYARERVAAEGLAHRVEVLCEDYRQLTGRYDRLVSIEMIEAVGHEFYANYFQRCSDLLKPEGKMDIQAITIADQRYAAARDSVDFIKRYIFPGGCLPSMEVICKHLAQDTDMQLVHLKDIGEDYAITLRHWHLRFNRARDQVRAMGFDEQFIRMWQYYLSYCEGGFAERIISTVQLSFAKPGYRLP